MINVHVRPAWVILKFCSLVPRFSWRGALNVSVKESMLSVDQRRYLVKLKIDTGNVMHAYSDNVRAVRQLARSIGCLGISP